MEDKYSIFSWNKETKVESYGSATFTLEIAVDICIQSDKDYSNHTHVPALSLQEQCSWCLDTNECRECLGEGELLEECSYCYGDGYNNYEEGDGDEECWECDGSGELEDCGGYCLGDGICPECKEEN